MSVTHRRRVRRLLSGRKPGRPVVDLGGFVSSFTADSYLDLKAYLGFGRIWDDERLSSINTVENVDERILAYFDIPFRRITPSAPSGFKRRVNADGSFTDEWGIVLRPMGHYYERGGQPLAEASVKDLDDYPWPVGDDPTRFSGLNKMAHEWYHQQAFSLVAGAVWSGVFQECWYLRGMERFLMDMLANKEFAYALLERVADVHICWWRAFLKEVGEYVDLVETADDLGGQQGPLVSPQLYREMVKPVQARLFRTIRSGTRARILYHTCGAVMPLIEDLIEIGMQVLNPIQPLPGRMDPEELCRRFGDRLTFHGGLDVQKLLPEGNPAQVRAHVQRYYQALGIERYIMAPANTVLPGTPPENLVAAYEAVKGLENYRPIRQMNHFSTGKVD
ncbi:MAG: uroporphyrinogen decarboxylase family protein [Anaerolineales bacterium]|jgi:uroporphyrinogen decarboxylase